MTQQEMWWGPKPIIPPIGHAAQRVRLSSGATQLSAPGMMQTMGFEAVILTPYYDSVGVLTLYFGHTAAAGAPVPVLPWNGPSDLATAVSTFQNDAMNYLYGVLEAFSVPLTQAQLDAAFDFNYNTGAIGVANWVKLFNAGNVEAARAAILNWDQPPSIVARRQAEQSLFFDGVYSEDGTTTEYRATAAGAVLWGTAQRIDLSGVVSHVG